MKNIVGSKSPKVTNMKISPSINQVSILGLITKVEYKPHFTFRWQFNVDVISKYRNEATLPCGTTDRPYGNIIQNATIGKDWILINGKVRNEGFIQVRDLYVINGVSDYPPPIHHVALLGKISDISEYPDSIYIWKFEIDVYREYGSNDYEATLTCGLGSGNTSQITMIENANLGQWVSVQGKVRNNGFIQVRSFCTFDVDND